MRRTKKPFIKDEMLFDAEAAVSVAMPIQVGSKDWFAWLARKNGFIYEGNLGHFTARCELRRGISYWYAYRRLDGKLAKVYLGRSEELTRAHLEEASAVLAGQAPLQRLVIDGDSSDLISGTVLQSSLIKPNNKPIQEMPKTPLSKITPPALPQNLTSRSHLIKRFNTPVTIIFAPSGYGTTTLINEWQQKCGVPVAWVSLDANDNDARRFWSSVVTALQSINPELGQDWLTTLRDSSPSTLSTIVVNLTNDIIRAADANSLSQWLGLVLDNYHQIRNPEIHTSLQTLLEHLPPTMKLIIGSHTQPPLALGYLRAKGMVTELDIKDLRFSMEEGIEYILQNMPAPYLAYSQMQTLVNRVEGWITGLVFAITVLTQQWDRSLFLGSFNGQLPLLKEFFEENVLHLQSVEVKDFLLKISILKKITGPLCDAITGRSDSAEVLRKLSDRNLFITQLEETNWYRLNSIFADVLSTKLHEHYPNEIERLNLQAANWFRTQDMLADAIHHLLIGKAWEEAAILIDKVALYELEKFGEDSRLLGWLLQIPPMVLQTHANLCAITLRLAAISYSSMEVNKLLEDLESGLLVDQNSDSRKSLNEIRQFRKIFSTSNTSALEPVSTSESDQVRTMLDGMVQSVQQYRVDILKAEKKASQVYGLAQKEAHLYALLMTGGGCAGLTLSQGLLRQSEQIAQQVLRQAYTICNKFPEPASISLIVLSEVFYLRNQLQQAHQFLVRATEVNPTPTSTNEIVPVGILRAKIQSALGDNQAAFSTIQATRELHALHPSSVWLDQDLIAYLELFRLRIGDLDTTDLLPMDRGDIDQSPFTALIRAEIHIEHKRSVAAEEILVHLINKYPHGAYKLTPIRIKLVLAIALFEQRKYKEAVKALIEVSRMAAPEYCIRPFLDYGAKIISLVSLVLRTENLTPGVQTFLKGLLNMLEKTNGTQKILSRDESATLAIAASISPREQQVLQLICTGLSNREIAQRCCISLSTVKTHIENIYQKLEVNSRMQAIAKAQMFELL